MENMKKEAKLVFNMGVARALFKAGCTAIDCKPDRVNPDKTVLVFKNDETFRESLKELTERLQKQRLQM
jgi:hypothetical protein